MEPKDKRNCGYIFEIKVVKENEDIEKKLEEALEQIEKKDYKNYLEEREVKDIVKVGIAFKGKEAYLKI